MANPDSRDVSLSAGTGRLVVDPEGSAALVLTDLGPAPAGKTYELWIVPGGDIDDANRAGIFAGSDGAEIVGVEGTVGAGDLVAVTIEDAGGVEAPTTPPIVASDPV